MIRKKEKKPLFQNIRNYFREYCNCSSIHGFRYFGEKRTIFERVWWFFVFFSVLAGCIYAIYLVYNKWDTSPVIVSFATRETPIYKIPFPVVTICPEAKYDKKAFDYSKLKVNTTNLTIEDRKKLEYMALICSSNPEIDNILSDSGREILDPVDVFNFYNEIKPDFLIDNCLFMGKPLENCDQFFTPLITDEGVCFSFNMVNRSDIFTDATVQYSNFQLINETSNWSLEYGYDEDADIDTAYPKRAKKPGVKNGLQFDIVADKNNTDYTCKDSIQGYRISIHTAIRLPRPSQQYFRLPVNQAVMAAVQPIMITTSKSVKKYRPEKRECYFTDERTLKYFKSYSQFNCWMECLTNYTYHMCDCVHFFMPRQKGMPICGFKNLKCMEDAEVEMEFKDLVHQLEISNSSKKSTRASGDCHCLPICTDLTYDVVTSQSHYDWENGLQAWLTERGEDLPDNFSSSLQERFVVSKATIFFKSSYFTSSQRNELYGPTDFLANFGGLLGLFTGFSVLSFMEIIYFLSVRLICNIKLYGYWSGPREHPKQKD